VSVQGTNFPHELTDNSINIVAQDNTNCVVVYTSENQMLCQTASFQLNSLGQTLSVTTDVNGNTPTLQSNVDFVIRTQNMKTQALNPSSVSPVLKTLIDITVDPGFSNSFNAADFTVQIKSKSASNYIKKLPVVAAHDSNKTITVKFAGAISGDYSIHVNHSQWGLIDTSALTLKVESYVSNIQPM